MAVPRARSRASRNPRSTTEIDRDNTYDSDGRLVLVYQPVLTGSPPYLDHKQHYDELNRVVQTDQYDEIGTAQTTTTAYHGMSTTVTNPKAQSKTEYRDALGQIAQMRDAMNNNTVYVRDAWSNLAAVSDPGGNLTQILYDPLGRKTDLIDPDLGHLRYCIDARGLTWQQLSPIAAAGVSNGNYCTQAWSQAQNFLNPKSGKLSVKNKITFAEMVAGPRLITRIRVVIISTVMLTAAAQFRIIT